MLKRKIPAPVGNLTPFTYSVSYPGLLEDNIKIDIKEIDRDYADWINLVQDRDQWCALVNTVMNTPSGVTRSGKEQLRDYHFFKRGVLSLGVKRPGLEADYSPPSSAEVNECVELFLTSHNTSSWRGA
jgi:hypothetical protein